MKQLSNKTKLIALAVLIVGIAVIGILLSKKNGDSPNNDNGQNATSGDVINKTNKELEKYEQMTSNEPSQNEFNTIMLFFSNYFSMRKDNKMTSDAVDEFFKDYMYGDDITEDKTDYLEKMIIPYKVDINNVSTPSFKDVRLLKREGKQAVFSVTFSFTDGTETEDYYGMAETCRMNDDENDPETKIVHITTFAPLNGSDKEKNAEFIESFNNYVNNYDSFDAYTVTYKERLNMDAELLNSYDAANPGADRESELSEDLYKVYSGETVTSDAVIVPRIVYYFRDLKNLSKDNNDFAKGSYEEVLQENSVFPTEYDNIGSTTSSQPTCILDNGSGIQALVIAKGIAITNSNSVSELLNENNLKTLDGKAVNINGVITKIDALRIVVLSVDDVTEPAKLSNEPSDIYYQLYTMDTERTYIYNGKIDDKYYYTSDIKSGNTIFNIDGTVKGYVYGDNEVTTNMHKYIDYDQLTDLVKTLTTTKEKLSYMSVKDYLDYLDSRTK